MPGFKSELLGSQILLCTNNKCWGVLEGKVELCDLHLKKSRPAKFGFSSRMEQWQNWHL